MSALKSRLKALETALRERLTMCSCGYGKARGCGFVRVTRHAPKEGHRARHEATARTYEQAIELLRCGRCGRLPATVAWCDEDEDARDASSHHDDWENWNDEQSSVRETSVSERPS